MSNSQVSAIEQVAVISTKSLKQNRLELAAAASFGEVLSNRQTVLERFKALSNEFFTFMKDFIILCRVKPIIYLLEAMHEYSIAAKFYMS